MPLSKAPPLPDGLTDARTGAQTQGAVAEWGLFELPASGVWEAGDPTKGEPKNYPKMTGCRPVAYYKRRPKEGPEEAPVESTSEYSSAYKADPHPKPVTLWHSRAMGFSDAERTALREWFGDGEDGGTWPARYGPGDWALARFDRQAGRWEIADLPLDRWRVELLEALADDGTATAKVILYDGTEWVVTDVEIEIHLPPGGSPLGIGDRVLVRRVATGPAYGDAPEEGEEPTRSRWEVEIGGGGSVRIAETPTGGIGAGGSATVAELNMDGSPRLDDDDEPIEFTAYNVFTSGIAEETRILTLPWRHDTTKEIVIAEDCPADE